jgi:hypothetical protein
MKVITEEVPARDVMLPVPASRPITAAMAADADKAPVVTDSPIMAAGADKVPAASMPEAPEVVLWAAVDAIMADNTEARPVMAVKEISHPEAPTDQEADLLMVVAQAGAVCLQAPTDQDTKMRMRTAIIPNAPPHSDTMTKMMTITADIQQAIFTITGAMTITVKALPTAAAEAAACQEGVNSA